MRSKMYLGLHVKYQLFLSDFDETWIFSTFFLKIFSYQIYRQPVQWEPSFSMRTDGGTDGQRDMTEIIVVFWHFTNAPKMIKALILYCCVTFVRNPLNTDLNPSCHLLALLGPHPIFHVSRIRVNIDMEYWLHIRRLTDVSICSNIVVCNVLIL
jgi:hypothetical protein